MDEFTPVPQELLSDDWFFLGNETLVSQYLHRYVSFFEFGKIEDSQASLNISLPLVDYSINPDTALLDFTYLKFYPAASGATITGNINSNDYTKVIHSNSLEFDQSFNLLSDNDVIVFSVDSGDKVKLTGVWNSLSPNLSIYLFARGGLGALLISCLSSC